MVCVGGIRSASCPGDNEQQSVWQHFAVTSVHGDI